MNSRILNTVVICSQNGSTGKKKKRIKPEILTKESLKVYNLGERKMIPEGKSEIEEEMVSKKMVK